MIYKGERKPGNNTRYQVEDAMMAAFSIFFTQSESFLDHQRLMKSNKGKDNAESLFSIEKIPCDNQIRNFVRSGASSYYLYGFSSYGFSRSL